LYGNDIVSGGGLISGFEAPNKKQSLWMYCGHYTETVL